ncbi:hypothetical protein ACOZB2_04000 [Pantoea endophytica]
MNKDNYSKLKAVIKETTGKTPSGFFADLSDKIISDNNDVIDAIPEDDYELKNVRQVRFSDSMLHKLSLSAKEHRWSMAKEIRFRINQTLESIPVLLDDELAELRGARNAVDRIGQNLYYIIAKRQILSVNDPALWDDIKKLNVAIEEVKSLVYNITSARANVLNLKKSGSKSDGR